MVGRLSLILCAAHSVASMIDQWTLATGNIGGGPPQPEYLEPGWQKDYGEFEKVFGGTILFTALGTPDKWNDEDKEKWSRYSNYAKNKFSTHFKSAGDILETDTMPETKKLPAYNPNFNKLSELNIDNWIIAEFNDGKTISGAEGGMKDRKVFPYLTQDFHDLAKCESKKKRGKLVEEYLGQIGSTQGLIDQNTHEWKQDAQNWPYVMLYDLLIVQMFRMQFTKDSKLRPPPPYVVMEDEVASCKINEIMHHAWLTNDIFFVQEIKSCKRCQNQNNCVCSKTPNENEDDTAILFNRRRIKKHELSLTEKVEAAFLRTLNVLKDNLDDNKGKANAYYKYLNMGKKSFQDAYNKYDDKAQKYKTKEKFAKFINPPKFIFFVGDLDKTSIRTPIRVMLMSGHPDSDGIFCRLYLAVAKDVFEEIQREIQESKEKKIDKLIVGMDINIQPTDYKKGESKSVFENLGYKVLWPAHPTVNKIRTFFQSQISKAAKVDKVVKDVLFYYPADKESKMTADVYNKFVKKDKTYVPGYVGHEQYPKKTWPMDHFIVYADDRNGNDKIIERKSISAVGAPGSDCQRSRTTKALSVQKLARVVRRIVHFVKQASTGLKSMPP